MCVLKCFFKLSVSEATNSQWLHVFGFLLCAFSNVPSNYLSGRMQSHIGCIWLTFCHSAFSNVSSTFMSQRILYHAGCTCLAFLYCAFLNYSSNCQLTRMQSCINRITVGKNHVGSSVTNESFTKVVWLSICLATVGKAHIKIVFCTKYCSCLCLQMASLICQCALCKKKLCLKYQT